MDEEYVIFHSFLMTPPTEVAKCDGLQGRNMNEVMSKTQFYTELSDMKSQNPEFLIEFGVQIGEILLRFSGLREEYLHLEEIQKSKVRVEK